MRLGSQEWTVASLATGAAALVGLLLAIATTHWLHMTEMCIEHIPVENMENMTIIANLTTYTNAGILQFCTKIITEFAGVQLNEETTCLESGISKGLDKNNDRDDSQWRTGTVMEATRIQFPLTCLAVLLTLSGFVCSIIGNFRRDKRTIIAAVLYISSGLCLSVSVILFISRINDELSLQESRRCHYFSYMYGWSFYLIGLSFVMEETSAVISIKLYLIRKSNKLTDILQIIPGLEDKFYVDMETMESDNHTMIW